MEERVLNDQQLVRREKMNALREKGIDPFGQAYKRDANSKSLKEAYGECTEEELAEKAVIVSEIGRAHV